MQQGNNAFNRERLQKAFNNIEQSDPFFADLFTDIDLYSNRLGTGDQKQSDMISSLIKEIDKADLLNSDSSRYHTAKGNLKVFSTVRRTNIFPVKVIRPSA